MDFFNSQQQRSLASPYDGLDTPFNQAINDRYSTRVSSSLLTTKFSPPLALQTPMVPSLPSRLRTTSSHAPFIPSQGLASSPIQAARRLQIISSPAATQFEAYEPETISSVLGATDILFIDLRPFTQFQSSHIPNAVSLSAPTTLLKRPGFSLEKLQTMLSDEDDSRSRFSRWRTMSRLIIYDVDTTVLSEQSSILSLLRKFQIAGFQGTLGWIKGGFIAFANEKPALVSFGAVETTPRHSDPDQGPMNVFIRTRNLPSSAFRQASTTRVGQPAPLGSGTANEPTEPPSSVVLPANPFFDNIRQNVELSHGITDRISLQLPSSVIERQDDLPFKWLQDIVSRSLSQDDDGDTLARQFYRIELGEQRRLKNVMDYHSRETTLSASKAQAGTTSDFPFSITAGFEMGIKNRYRDIWPFEHARVRLGDSSSGTGSDYVNASYVQPLGSRRRYIATQGPLASTFDDFWTICWEQKVPVIVMLTREIESSLVKCGKYWRNGVYGGIRIKLVSQKGDSDNEKSPQTMDSGFGFSLSIEDPLAETTIERVFEISHIGHPNEPPRRITHIQYLGWPDMNVPASAHGLLKVIKRLNGALEDPGTAKPQGPILLHCSAGVGRTGGFILVDAILEGIREEIKKMKRTGQEELTGSTESNSDAMDVDEPESVTTSSQSDSPNPNFTFSYSSPASTNHFSSDSLLPAISETSVMATPSVVEKPMESPASKPSALTSARRTAMPKPKRLSHLLSNKFRKATSSPQAPGVPSPSFKIVEWSRRVETPSTQATPSQSTTPAPETSSFHVADYKVPRMLHRDDSPPPLSSFSDPIQEVLEDMREQRMSLCQSLRQYVFAHRAIIEGALEIVDEERSAALVSELLSSSAPQASAEPWSSNSSIASIPDSSLVSSPPRVMAGRLSSENRHPSDPLQMPPIPPKVSMRKRSASPTDESDEDPPLKRRTSVKRR